MSRGNEAAANGWLERASTLVAEHEVAPLAGWVSLACGRIAGELPSGTSATSRPSSSS